MLDKELLCLNNDTMLSKLYPLLEKPIPKTSSRREVVFIEYLYRPEVYM